MIYQLPIGAPPEVVSIGIGMHGKIAREHFFVPGLWCVHLFCDPLDLTVNGQHFDVLPGGITFMPPSVPIAYFFPTPCVHRHLYVMFRVAESSSGVSVPALKQWGSEFAAFFNALNEAMVWHATQPTRCQARCWEILWQLAVTPTASNREEQLVRQARDLIEKRLHQPMSVAALARELNVSHNHLTRRFRAETGQTVVNFIRSRRVERARNLLRHTTLPIKAVAAQSGLGDFHAFNKAMRRTAGQSPRALRSETVSKDLL